MALSDLTSPAAVTAALDEQDAIGREAFLKKYGFRDARTYFVLRDGRTYPSKAIAAAAHGYEHGEPLTAAEFSGGDDTVAPRLERLGFRLLRADREWMYPIGKKAVRSDIHGTYGGGTQGGIEPSGRTPNVLIYTDPEEGAKNGYDYDGWDGNDPNVFYYTGEGRHGDQRLVDGNKAILDHVADGRTLRLWRTIDTRRTAPPGGKRQEFMGDFYVDPSSPYRMEPAPDADRKPRRVIVFRLVRAGATPAAVDPQPPGLGDEAEQSDVPEPPAELSSDHAGGVGIDLSPPTDAREYPSAEAPLPLDLTGDATVTLVPSEQNEATEFEVAPTTGRIASRDEAKLVNQFETWLRRQSHDPQRLRIRIPGERHELVTDTYDATDGVLYEAKSKSDRATVRLAIGQLLDYLRFAPDAVGSILLPTEPSADVKRLVRSVGFGLVYRRLGSWVIEAAERDAV